MLKKRIEKLEHAAGNDLPIVVRASSTAECEKWRAWSAEHPERQVKIIGPIRETTGFERPVRVEAHHDANRPGGNAWKRR